MIGFEITAVCVSMIVEGKKKRPAMKQKRKEKMYNMLEGDSAERLSHHYHLNEQMK